MSSTLRGKHLHTQTREMAFNVYQWIKSQNEDQCTKEIKEKVSRATGVSESMNSRGSNKELAKSQIMSKTSSTKKLLLETELKAEIELNEIMEREQ
ncbi:hypothetical protein FQA39_LY01477 [Lamprigera yunnana]|nr:hypothetical protein FQA39_LY01477 [Lamprigera yunnana]